MAPSVWVMLSPSDGYEMLWGPLLLSWMLLTEGALALSQMPPPPSMNGIIVKQL